MALSPLGNNMNPLASFRQTTEQARRIMNPMGEYRRAMEATKPVDFLGSRITDQARLTMNPTAEARRALELANPLASYSQTMEQARRIIDPMGEYRRIVQNFSGLVGIDPASIAVEGLDDGDGLIPETAPNWLAQNPALVVTLLSIAWCCGWLLAKGADIERVGGLLLAALGLAAYLAEKQSDERS